MGTIFDPQVRSTLLLRASSLRPDRPALWGSLTAPQLICHLTASLPSSAGEPRTGGPRSALSRFPVNSIDARLCCPPWAE